MPAPRARSAASALRKLSLSEIHSALASEKIPKADTPQKQAENAIRRAGGSLLAVGTYNLASDRLAASKFLANWSNIWRWIEYLHLHCVLTKSYGESIMQASIFAIGCALQSLSKHDGLRNLVSTSDVLSVVMYYWLKEGNDVNVKLANADGLFSRTLQSLLRNVEHDPSLLTSIIDAADGGANNIADISLEHLHKALDVTPIDCADIYIHLQLVGIFASYSCPLLRTALHSKRPISAAVKAVSVVSASAIDSLVKDAIVETCYITIANVLGTVEGPSEVCRVLDDGLLVSLLILSTKLMHLTVEARKGVTDKIFEFLGHHLVFRSVLGSVAKSFEKIQNLDMDTVAAGPMWEAWLEFKNAAEERMVRRQYFDEDEKTVTGLGYGCQREECPAKSNNIGLLICSSCKSSQYCGKICQRLDWPMHRNGCKAMQRDLNAGTCIELSTRDRRFINYVARDDYQFELHALLPAILQQYSGIPLSGLFARVNYQSFPPSYSVLPVSSFQWNAEEITHRDELLRLARESEGERILVRVEYLLGTFIRTGFLLISSPEKFYVKEYIAA